MPIGTYDGREILLAPSILAADFARLGEQACEAQAAGVDWLQADVMDGRFVPNISFGPLVVEALKPITTCVLDCHLMIVEPERYVDAFAAAGAQVITVHAEAATHLHRVVQQIKGHGIKAGVALNPASPLLLVEEIAADIDLLLIMSVNPGFGGQKFIESSIDKVRRARRLLNDHGRSDVIVQVDGGVSASNVRSLVEAGATCLVAGSSVFGHPEGVAQAVEEFRDALR